VKFYLEIQRGEGMELRDIRTNPNDATAIAEGACPGCGAVPFVVYGRGMMDLNSGRKRADGYSMCCSDQVGYIYAEPETIFGVAEDAAIRLRARVYT
jgi:hypothetical protein